VIATVNELEFSAGGAAAPDELMDLRRSAGWAEIAVSDDEAREALERTWNVTVRDASGRLVALARVLDDGVFYATIWDMLVLPEYRQHGIGTRMLSLVLEHCLGRQIVSLVATPAGRPLYERAGFAQESRGSVGMLRRSEAGGV
jgi:GNAT superfamily N-acetyltransferase